MEWLNEKSHSVEKVLGIWSNIVSGLPITKSRERYKAQGTRNKKGTRFKVQERSKKKGSSMDQHFKIEDFIEVK